MGNKSKKKSGSRTQTRTRQNLERLWRFITFRAPARQPTLNSTITVPMTIGLSYLTTGSFNTAIRIEDVLKSFWKLATFNPTEWAPKTSVRVQKVLCYGLISKYDVTWAPSISFAIFDLVTGVEYKRVAAIGDVDDPPRLGWHLPDTMAANVFQWDGTAGTSTTVAGVTTGETGIEISVYVYCVFTLGNNDITQWHSLDETMQPSSSSSGPFLEIDPQEVLSEVQELRNIWSNTGSQ